MKRAILFIVLFGFGSTVFAQNRRVLEGPPARLLNQSGDEARPSIRHLTAELLASENGQAALAEYGRLKRAGQLPYAKKQGSFDIGDLKTFSVAILDSPSGAWENVQFTKVAEEPLFDLWVETAELNNGHVTNADVEQMRIAFTAQTPEGSFNPQAGVIENDLDIFGPAPNVDGDGKLDVLVLDVRDGWSPETGGGITLGYFDPVNLVGQNNADIIHIDSYPGITDHFGRKFFFGLPEQTLAHEFQHLIYDTVNQGFDVAFTNEALSTFGEIVNGFGTPITGIPDYLENENEWTRALLGWRSGGGPDLEDYQRGGLFMSYLADRIGVLETGVISRTVQFAAEALQVVLNDAGLQLHDVLAEFHIANLLNDPSLGEAYAHTRGVYQNARVANVPTVDGTSANSMEKVTRGIGQGGAYYYAWENVRDLVLLLTEENGRPDLIQPFIVLEKEIGPLEIRAIDFSDEGLSIIGNYTRITLILPHVDILDWNPNANPVDSDPPRALVGITAQWQEFESSVQIVNTIYDTGIVAFFDQANVIPLTPEIMKANRFVVPPGGVLQSVLVDQVYQTDFSNTGVPPNAPRDYELVIWSESSAGLPGDELFSVAVTDLSISGTTEFLFHTIDLTPYSDVLSTLPAVVFIGVRNVGADQNHFHMTLSEYSEPDTPSYLFADLGDGLEWSPFSEICVGDCAQINLQDYVLPIRAVFLIDSGVTATEDDLAELPKTIALEQNYPNPFNPVTAIRFSLPSAMNVDLRVFDLLGREVDLLVNDLLPGGDHEVHFDANTLASGIYIYKLEVGSESLTRTMTLLK